MVTSESLALIEQVRLVSRSENCFRWGVRRRFSEGGVVSQCPIYSSSLEYSRCCQCIKASVLPYPRSVRAIPQSRKIRLFLYFFRHAISFDEINDMDTQASVSETLKKLETAVEKLTGEQVIFRESRFSNTQLCSHCPQPSLRCGNCTTNMDTTSTSACIKR